MMYLAAGLVLWLIRAVAPASVVIVVGALVAWIAHRVGGVSLRGGMLAVAALGFVVLAWQTRAVRREFTHPQITMFRKYIADPIPDGVRNLAPGTSSPLVFHAGAVVAFDAADETLRALLDHSLPGSTARAFLKDLKSRNGRDTTTVARIGAPDGGYVRVDSASFPAELAEDFPGAHMRVTQESRRGMEVYLLAEKGEWGRLESVVVYDRPRQHVSVRQLVVRGQVLRD
jgi:membrane protein implicated in regulation of membrane protease activity